MNEFKLGDIVYIKTVKDVQIVVSIICKGGIQGIYYSPALQEFKLTPFIPNEALLKSN